MVIKGPVTARSLIADDASPIPWADAAARLAEGSTYWLATGRRDGRPHVVSVLAVWVDDALHFVACAASRKAKNIARDSRCIITTSTSGLDLVVEGEARKVRDEAKLHRVADVYASKYGWHVTVRDGAFHDAEGAPTAGPPPYEVYEVVPAVAFGFGTEDETISGAARYRF